MWTENWLTFWIQASACRGGTLGMKRGRFVLLRLNFKNLQISKEFLLCNKTESKGQRLFFPHTQTKYWCLSINVLFIIIQLYCDSIVSKIHRPLLQRTLCDDCPKTLDNYITPVLLLCSIPIAHNDITTEQFPLLPLFAYPQLLLSIASFQLLWWNVLVKREDKRLF